MNIGYSEAAVEVLDILDHTKKEDVEKISKKFTNFLKEQSSKTYKSTLDHSKTIKEMNLKPKTQALLGLIYLNYWADEEGKKEFKTKIKENEKQYQQELSEKYSVDNLFKKSENNIQETTQLPVVVKEETFIQKIINKIKNIFRR